VFVLAKCPGAFSWKLAPGIQDSREFRRKEDLLDMMPGRIMEGRTVRDTGRRLPRGRLDAAESEREAG